MTNYGDVTGPRWVGGVNAPASGGGGRRPVNIPAEVINRAAKAYFLASEAEMGFTDSTWFGESGATEETREQFRWAAFQMAPVIAEWARKEALREAADAIEKLDGHFNWDEIHRVAPGLRSLAEGVSDGQQ